jgi:ribosomal protein S18 acetylase RimI-like enzyme
MREDYAAVIRDAQVTVVQHEGAIVAVLVLAVAGEGFLLDNVAVEPAHQGTGLGRYLLDYAESEAVRQGFDSIYLYTQEAMTENLALYERLGYVEYARRAEIGLSRVYLRKQLATGAQD